MIDCISGACAVVVNLCMICKVVSQALRCQQFGVVSPNQCYTHLQPEYECLAELDSKVALLPAVLQSEDSVSLVDHLSSIFSEQDWTGLAK